MRYFRAPNVKQSKKGKDCNGSKLLFIEIEKFLCLKMIIEKIGEGLISDIASE